MYDVQADSINAEEIAINENNRIALDSIKGNDGSVTYLYIQREHDEDWEDWVDYVPEGTNDMGWLGYFVGKNDHLKELHLREFDPPSGANISDVLAPFFKGVNNNKSIRELNFEHMDLLDGRVFSMLGPFFENCPTLVNLTVGDCHLGDEGWRLLALAIGSSKHQTLQNVTLSHNNISDEASVDIITSLSMHPHLDNIWWTGNRINTKGCTALATLLRCSATKLKNLYLYSNEINDEGLEALVPSLNNCSHLKSVSLDYNLPITSKGWQQLASILAAPNSKLTTLSIRSNNIDDKAVTAFARALLNNRSLKTLHLDNNRLITVTGWEVLSKLLCNTSSINATFLSNHTLQTVMMSLPDDNPMRSLLTLNKQKNKKGVAMIKILQNHNDFVMMPLFEWEFKVLPLMIDWFERASSTHMPEGFEPNIESRKLSSIYQFVRGMPLLYVETQLRRELEVIKSEELSLEEEQNQMRKKQLEMERKQLQLRHQQLVLDVELQQFQQRKQSVKEHKESLLEKLAR